MPRGRAGDTNRDASIQISLSGIINGREQPSGVFILVSNSALPFLGMAYTAMLIYESRIDLWKVLRQLLSFGFFAALAYVNTFRP